MKGKGLQGRVSFFLFFSIILSSCGTPTSPQQDHQPINTEDTLIPQYVARDVVHYHYENGVLKVKVRFMKGAFYNATQELYVENCDFVYYDITGAVVSHGSSKRAILYDDEARLFSEGDVVVVSEINRGKLETDSLEWYGDKDQFITDSFVTITRENGDIATGYGFVADTALRYVTIKKNVRGSIREDRE